MATDQEIKKELFLQWDSFREKFISESVSGGLDRKTAEEIADACVAAAISVHMGDCNA